MYTCKHGTSIRIDCTACFDEGADYIPEVETTLEHDHEIIGRIGCRRCTLDASAPELFSAIKELVNYIRCEYTASHPLCEAADRADKAIDKAEGR
jgi:hypothetical protein